jgi:hypothetical protein
LDHVPWFHIYVPDDYLETSGIYMLTKRQARKRDKAKAKARKLRNPRLARRRNRRQIITFVIFFIVVLGVIFKLPEDPFNKHPAPPSGPAITQPATVTTVTP